MPTRIWSVLTYTWGMSLPPAHVHRWSPKHIPLIVILWAMASSGWAANNPDLSINGQLVIQPYLVVGESEDVVASITWPSGFAGKPGSFQWTIVGNFAAIGSPGSGSSYATPAGLALSSTIQIKGLAIGKCTVRVQWSGAGIQSNEMTQGVEVVEIVSKTSMPTADRSPDSRTTIGLDEMVVFSCSKTVVKWTTLRGSPTESAAAKFAWAATTVPGELSIYAHFPGGYSARKRMTVIQPTRVEYYSPSQEMLPPGRVGAYMFLKVRILPPSVNWEAITIREKPNQAEEQYTGWFLANPMVHDPSGGKGAPSVGAWQSIINNNELSVPDKAGFHLAVGDWPAPGTHTCTWPIPIEFKAIQWSQTLAAKVQQVHQMNAQEWWTPPKTTPGLKVDSTESKDGSSVQQQTIKP